MQKITQKFIENTSIEINDDVIRVFEFIASPDSVQKMITSTENGKPALAGIVHELEERFADCDGFPLNHEGLGKNAKNRRNVGWMIRFVMREYGYTPIDNSERTRIGADAGSVYFGNAAVYHLTNSIPNYEIASQAFVLCRKMTAKDLYIKKDDYEYEQIREGVSYINKRRKDMYLSDEFVRTFLSHAGFNGLLSTADVDFMFKGLKVPCRNTGRNTIAPTMSHKITLPHKNTFMRNVPSMDSSELPHISTQNRNKIPKTSSDAVGVKIHVTTLQICPCRILPISKFI